MDTFSSITAPTVEHAAAPTRDAARGLLGDCDLRWLVMISSCCAVALWMIAAR
jgi:hypothetical protein